MAVLASLTQATPLSLSLPLSAVWQPAMEVEGGPGKDVVEIATLN